MLAAMVWIVVGFVANTNAGYNYHAPNTNLGLPNGYPSNYGYNYAASSQPTNQNAFQYAGSSVSYSVAPSDYNYLRQYRNGPYQYQTGFAPITSHQDNNYQINNYNSVIGGYYNHGNDHIENTIPAQTVQHQSGGISLSQTYNAEPVVTKHIYFHVPPAEIEEKPVQTVPSEKPKKIYNIVFIKVPSQGSRNGGNIPGITVNQQAPVQDKTLIYVLVKKPDSQLILQRPPVRSQHEVFYVKYKGDVSDVANQINGQLPQQTFVQSAPPLLQSDVQSAIQTVVESTGSQSVIQPSISTALQPGLVNGNL